MADLSHVSFDNSDGGLNIHVQNPGSSVSAATATLSSVAADTTSKTLLAADSNTKWASVFNDSSATMYLAYGTTASTTAFTTKVPAQTLWEMPPTIYTGAISAIWDSAVGNARVTKVVS